MSDDLSLQSTERDGQGIDGSDPRERTRRVRNGGHVLYCRGIRIKALASVSEHCNISGPLDTHSGVISIECPSYDREENPAFFDISRFVGTQKRVLVSLCPSERGELRLVVDSPSVFALDTLRHGVRSLFDAGKPVSTTYRVQDGRPFVRTPKLFFF
jgi:hypothetical protein